MPVGGLLQTSALLPPGTSGGSSDLGPVRTTYFYHDPLRLSPAKGVGAAPIRAGAEKESAGISCQRVNAHRDRQRALRTEGGRHSDGGPALGSPALRSYPSVRPAAPEGKGCAEGPRPPGGARGPGSREPGAAGGLAQASSPRPHSLPPPSPRVLAGKQQRQVFIHRQLLTCPLSHAQSEAP